MDWLAAQVTILSHHGLTLANVMAGALARGIQLLQHRIQPMWEFNRTDDLTCALQGEFHNGQIVATMLASMFKVEEANFLKEPMFDGFPASNPCKQ